MSADILLMGYCLATAKRYEEAESLLSGHPTVAQSTVGLDLLARIRVEQGDEVTARRLWQAVLAQEPKHVGAMAALKMLDAPWETVPRARAIALRLVASVGVLAIAVIAWILGAASHGGPDVRVEAAHAAEVGRAKTADGRKVSERVVTINRPPTLQQLRTAQQELGLGEGDWLSVAAARDVDVETDTLGRAFQRSIAFVAAFSDVAGFPGERVLISACTNVAPPYAVLRVLCNRSGE